MTSITLHHEGRPLGSLGNRSDQDKRPALTSEEIAVNRALRRASKWIRKGWAPWLVFLALVPQMIRECPRSRWGEVYESLYATRDTKRLFTE